MKEYNYSEMLTNKYLKLREDEMVYQAESLELPVGSIQKKTIKGKAYHYLQYRDGSKVHSQYIKKSELDSVRAGIERRKELSRILSKIDSEKRAIESLVDANELIIAEIKKAVCDVAKDYSFITKIALFGSRAAKTNRPDSDVDLIFESSEPVSLLIQSEIRTRIESAIGRSVDLVHGPLKDDAFLEIGKEIQLYGA